MNDFDLNPIISERVVVVLQRDNEKRKLFQIMFLRDGSLTVSFPYFNEPKCQLAVGTMPNAAFTPTLKLDTNVWGSSHRVKYTHHLDGRAHFSQDGRIRTVVKRQAVPLKQAQGHVFTVSLQGLHAFKLLPEDQHRAPTKRRANAIIGMSGRPTDSLKIIGQVYQRETFKRSVVNANPPVGPNVTLQRPNGQLHNGVIVAAVHTPDLILALHAVAIPPLNKERPTIVFVGGFDPSEIVNDYTQTSDFLFMASPPGDFGQLVAKHGTVDLSL